MVFPHNWTCRQSQDTQEEILGGYPSHDGLIYSCVGAFRSRQLDKLPTIEAPIFNVGVTQIRFGAKCKEGFIRPGRRILVRESTSPDIAAVGGGGGTCYVQNNP